MIAGFTVHRGARLMDSRSPGWAVRINLYYLRTASADDCILGQEFGMYYRGLEALGIGWRRSAWYGFSILPFSRESSWARLDAAWQREIGARLPEPVAGEDRSLVTVS